MKRLFVIITGLLPAALANAPPVPDRTHSTAVRHPYVHRWEHATFGKRAAARVAAGAGINQLRGYPSKYGGGISGFGKRLRAFTKISTTTGPASTASPRASGMP